MSNLYIVNGLPASGKSTVVNKIADYLNLPLITKDAIKELLGETYTPKTVEDSQKLGSATFDLLYFMAEIMMKSGVDCIIEAAFDRQFAAPQLTKLVQKYNYTTVEIYCWCDNEVRRQRYLNRESSGSRHKVHLDNKRELPDKPSIPEPLNLNDYVFTLDSTAEYELGLNELYTWIKHLNIHPVAIK